MSEITEPTLPPFFRLNHNEPEQRKFPDKPDLDWERIRRKVVIHKASWRALEIRDRKLLDDFAIEYTREGRKVGIVQKVRVDPEIAMYLAGGRRMVLQMVELENGLRYAVPLEAETGQVFLNACEIDPKLIRSGSQNIDAWRRNLNPKSILRANIGAGWRITDIEAHPPPSVSFHEMSLNLALCQTSLVKSAESRGASHEVEYDIDNIRQYLSFRYVYKKPGVTKRIILSSTKPDPATGIYPPYLNAEIEIELNHSGQYAGGVRFDYDIFGRLNQIIVRGQSLRQLPPSYQNPQKESVVLKKADITNHAADSLIQRFLGRDSGSEVLDKKESLTRLIENIESKRPKDPLDSFMFTPVPESPALS